MAAWCWGDLGLMKLAVTGTAAAGVLAVFTSIMVYVDTRRAYWSPKLTAGKFLGTTLLLGAGLTGIDHARPYQQAGHALTSATTAAPGAGTPSA